METNKQHVQSMWSSSQNSRKVGRTRLNEPRKGIERWEQPQGEGDTEGMSGESIRTPLSLASSRISSLSFIGLGLPIPTVSLV